MSTAETAEVAKRPELQQRVPLKDIIKGENYRKTIDEAEYAGTKASIAEKGVLQSVLLRYTKDPKKFELVAGYIRFKSSNELAVTDPKKFFDIPAMIKDLTDEEVQEIQLIENLHRSQVPPMQEARGFKRLIDVGGKPIEEVAARIGKSPNYVARRLKLNDLAVEFQTALEKGRIDIIEAERLFQLSPQSQKKLWDSRFKSVPENQGFDIDQWVVDQNKGLLFGAPFDITDPLLNEKMGACTACPHNTAANTLLFPDAENKGTCGLIDCFNGKRETNFKARLKEAIEDPSIELITESYGTVDKSDRGDISASITILTRSDYSMLEPPEEPEVPEYEDYDPDESYEYTNKKEYEKHIKEQKQEYDDEVAEYKKELETYNKNVESGKFIKALLISGRNKGQWAMITIQKTKSNGTRTAGTTAALKEKAAEGKVTAADLGSEINRVKERMKRSRELDEEKIAPAIYEVFCKDPVFKNNNQKLSNDEKIALILVLNNDSDSISEYNRLKKSKAIDAELNKAVRKYIMKQLRQGDQWCNREKKGGTAIIEDIALAYMPKTAKEIRAAQMVEREKREGNANKKIEGLKKKIKELPPEKPKAAVKKKAAKKK